MSTLISINGIRRSGTHAVANWIISHFDNGCYINDATKSKFFKIKSDILPAHKEECKKIDATDSPDILIVGIENEIDNLAIITKIVDEYSKLVNAGKKNNVVLIRNYFNLMASHIKAWPNENYHKGIAKHWKKYIDFAKNNKYEIVIYDKWLESEYRHKISQDLGFVNKDKGLKEITKQGGGSSFGDKLPNSDNLKNRWKYMITNNQYMETVKSFHYWEDYINLFGMDEIYDFFTKK
jgi:hypothetical protein